MLSYQRKGVVIVGNARSNVNNVKEIRKNPLPVYKAPAQLQEQKGCRILKNGVVANTRRSVPLAVFVG